MAKPLETPRDTRGRNMNEYSTVRERLIKLESDLQKCLEENAGLKTDLFSVRDGIVNLISMEQERRNRIRSKKI